ncbi:amino acid adenylation domain-containing protein [Actinomadura sp. 9N407]|uniref:amino acid adenylation domain-containing protein n=1 Tax=Actinomadura sp. 9N407 TaxID=3375154 RepID=UPI0037A2C4B2
MSEPEGRGVAWTDERGTSEEGRRRQKAPQRLAGVTDAFPVSSGQERMWFLSRFEPDLAVYNVCLWMPMPQGTEQEHVERALAALAKRHEPLRTTFDFRDGQVVQLIHAEVPAAVTATDLGSLAGPEREAEFDRLARSDAAQPFPLDTAPLWRARLVRLDEEDLRLVWICDHTIFDGASSAIFVDELYEVLAAAAAGRPPDLPELRIQYADYAAWQRGRLTDDFLAGELRYWRRQLDGLPADLGLPADRARPAVRTYGGGLHRFALSPELTAQVDRLAKALGVTPFMTLLAAFKAVLARWAGRYDITVGCPMAGRVLPELEPLIGMFVNAVLVRTDLSGDPSFREAAQRVRDILLDAIDHQEMPFERLVEALQPQRDLSRPPLFQVAFNLVPSNTQGQIANGTTKVDLSLDLNVREGRLHGRLEFATDLFDAPTIERLAGWFQAFLTAAVRDPDQAISALPLMDERERERILAASRGPAMPLDADTVLTDLFAGAAPDDATAVIAPDGGTLTFGELHARANRLAHWLRSQRVGPETPVAICAERSPELVVGVLAVLKAGGVYMPLDPDHPWQRLSGLVAGSGARLVLTQAHLSGRLRNLPARLVPLEEDGAWRDLPDDEPARVNRPGDAAYLLYTSGTTGKPKAVVTTHEAIVNRLEWMRRSLPPGAVVLHKTPISFDVSVWELCLPPACGAALALARPGGHREPSYLRDLVKERRVTTAHFVPSMLAAFLAAEGVEECRSLRRVICSGEELPRDLAARCADRLPEAELHNLYGPAEAAIDVSAWRCEPQAAGPVPIGRPVPNTALYVLDERMALVPAGVPGELHIAGVQLARGYHGRPGRTAASFVANPFGPPGSRLYRTGDLARWRRDGAIEFLGRVDTQVKVHGVRVELGEIEAALAAHSLVERAAAALREDAPGGPGLVAYVVWSGDPGDITKVLRDHLSRKLPPAVIPQAFVPVEALPTGSSGKLDRAALPAPASAGRRALATGYRAPGTPMEEELCGIWRDLLGRDRVGALDDFFELGGHSLLVVELINRIRASFGVELPLRRCFEITTVERYALEILERRLDGQDLDRLLDAVTGEEAP